MHRILCVIDASRPVGILLPNLELMRRLFVLSKNMFFELVGRNVTFVLITPIPSSITSPTRMGGWKHSATIGGS